MSRTKIDLDTKLEVALIPKSTILISQGAGTAKDGITPLPTSQYNVTHMGYKALDYGGQFISVTATNREGGKYVTNLSKGVEIPQGDIFYRQGNEGVISSGKHAHVNAIKGLLPGNFNFYDYFYDYSQTDISNNEWTKASGFKNDSYLDSTKAGAMATGWVKVSGVDYLYESSRRTIRT